MAAVPGVWGIDIGQCGLKALRLEMQDGAVVATAFDYIEHPKILSQPDANPDELTREALEKFLSRNPVKGDKIAIGVPGQSGLARFVKLPPVEEKKIDDIVKFEAKQQIPFPLEEVVWDFQRIGQGQVSDGFAIDTEIGLFAMKRDMISRFMSHFQLAGLDIHLVQMAPLALCNYVTYDLMPEGPSKDERSKKKCVVALDLGTDNSNLIITDADKIIWQRPIPLGGNHFTRALTKEMKLTFAKAEHVKRNAAKSPELPAILKALRPVLTDFVGEVQRSLGYFTNTHRDAAVTYMVGIGSGFKLPGMQKYLAEKLNLDVRKPAKFERLTGDSVLAAPAFLENMLSFPVAYGLAAQGLAQARLTTNLLPPEIHRERLIRAKKPWAVAAAAMLLLGTGVLAFGASVPFSQASDKSIDESLKVGNAAKADAARIDTDIRTRADDVAATTLKVQSVISGQDERLNWIKLQKFIDDSLPVPGAGGNLNEPNQVALWNTQLGIEAAARYQDRLKNGLAPTESLEYAKREYLAAVDVEAVNTRYTDNLKGAYDNIEKLMLKALGRREKFPDNFEGSDIARLVNPDSWKEKPTGSGWLVEIRGSTFYNTPPSKTARVFLRDALLRNLIRNSLPPKVPPAVPAKEIDPIAGNVSHVFLYNDWVDKLPDPGKWKMIGASLIDSLNLQTGPDAADPNGAGAPPPMMRPGGETSSAGASAGAEPAWSPLLAGTDSGAGSGPGMGGESRPGRGGPMAGVGLPGAASMSAPGGASMSGPGGGGGGGGGSGVGGPYDREDTDPQLGAAADPNQPRKLIKPRYEFVVIFVWKEPTPSDKLLGGAAAPDK